MFSVRFSPVRALLLLSLILTTAPAWAAPVDVTTLGVVPNDGLDDFATLNAAIQANPDVYLPAGTYNLSDIIFIPSNRKISGAGIDQTNIVLLADRNAFRVLGQSNVTIEKMTLDRPFDNSFEEMIYAYSGAANVSLRELKVTRNRSRAPALRFIATTGCSIINSIVLDYQRQIVDQNENDPAPSLQVFGCAIAFENCDQFVVYGNQVIETRDLRIANPVKMNYYQAGAIQVGGSHDGLVECNYVERSGNGIDTSGAYSQTLRNNVVTDCHETGIKLVNGTNNMTVSGNTVTSCGITAIWLSPGSQNLPVHTNLVEDNIIGFIGRSWGEIGYWAGTFANTIPAGIHVDSASSTAGRSYNNTIRDNTFYQMGNAVGNVVVRSGSTSAINTTLSNNQGQAGNPPAAGPCPNPEPTPLPTPEPTPVTATAVIGSTENGVIDPADGLGNLFNKNYIDRVLIGQGATAGSARWAFKVDLGVTATVNSVALYGYYLYRNDEAAPGGLLRIEYASNVNGPWTVGGELNVGGSRASNPFTGGKGKRIQIAPAVSARYLRVSGGDWSSGFDNNVMITEMFINPRVVLHNYSPVHNTITPLPNSASVPLNTVWDIGGGVLTSRVGVDLVDGDPATGANPVQAATLTLDLSPRAFAKVDGFIIKPFQTDYSLLPKTGTIRVSSTDDPANFDTVVTNFNITVASGDLVIPFASTVQKRFFQFSWTQNQAGSGANNVRIGEIDFDGIAADPDPPVPVELSAFDIN